MQHFLQHISDLSELCYHYDIAHIIISPGSRNAPLIDTFTRRFKERCYSIVDERSAGYFALGLARQNRKPVVLVCTSGTATLNYGPALAEAYYQRIPLVAVTADRPAALIDQQDNQTIRQPGIYANYTKGSFELPENIKTSDDLNQAHTEIHRALRLCMAGSPGPVHINVPLDEPLYGELPVPTKNLQAGMSLKTDEGSGWPEDLMEQWIRSAKILIIHGQDNPDPETDHSLSKLAADPRVVVVAENLSNRFVSDIIHAPDVLLGHTPPDELLPPDMLIYSGGQLVSKKMKHYLRELKIPFTWRAGRDAFEMDTFLQDNRYVKRLIGEVYGKLEHLVQSGTAGEFKRNWTEAFLRADKKIRGLYKKIPFSDLWVVNHLLENVPEECTLEFGNSSPVRYSQLSATKRNLCTWANRGVSGIDGCLSAAAGTATAAHGVCFVVLGDLSFVYDSNALWNRRFPANLRIIVLNNQGGGIFGLIEGPRKKKAYEDFFIAHHPVSLQKLAEAFNLDYFCVTEPDKWNELLPLLSGKLKRAVVVEVMTARSENEAVFNRLTGRITDPDPDKTPTE